MAFTSIMTTEAEIDQKMGAKAPAAFTDVMKTAAAAQAESVVNVTIRNNFSDTYSTLNVDIRFILSDIVSGMVAMEGVAYDMSAYTSRIEAEDKVNILRDAILRNLSVLRDKKAQDFMGAA